MEYWLMIFWDLLYGIMVTVGVAGNVMVLWIVTVNRSMHTIPNAFIANMSLSDLLMATLNCISNYISMRDMKWHFSEAYCTANNFLAIVTVTASVMNLTAMSVDRYRAIVWPLKVRTSKFCVASTVVGIWIWSCLASGPAFAFSAMIEVSRGVFICYLKWPDETNGQSYYFHVYNVVLFMFTYVIPLILIGMCSIHMSVVLWYKPTVGVMTPQLQRQKRQKEKIVIMLMTLSVLFGVCWLPYHLYFIILYHHPDMASQPVIQNVYLAFYWLAMSHAIINPIVYYFMNTTYRVHFNNLMFMRFLNPNQPTISSGIRMASAVTVQVAVGEAPPPPLADDNDNVKVIAIKTSQRFKVRALSNGKFKVSQPRIRKSKNLEKAVDARSQSSLRVQL